MIFEAPLMKRLMKRLYGSGLGTSSKQVLQTKKRCYGQVSNSVHLHLYETSRNNNIQLSSFACVHIQSACL